MPPNSTQNLNAKLSLTTVEESRSGRPVQRLASPPTHSFSPQNKIVGGARQYRGGYHLNV